jgi:hypothetical protein
VSDSSTLRIFPNITTKQKEQSIVCYEESNPCVNMIPDLEVKFCGLDGKKRKGKIYLWFGAVGKTQTLTAETSASPPDTRPGSQTATGLFSLLLEAEIFQRCVSACL